MELLVVQERTIHTSQDGHLGHTPLTLFSHMKYKRTTNGQQVAPRLQNDEDERSLRTNPQQREKSTATLAFIPQSYPSALEDTPPVTNMFFS